jgi:hypothetical protein
LQDIELVGISQRAGWNFATSLGSASLAGDGHTRRLLRARRERPANHRAAEQRDKLASFHLIELHSTPASQGRIAGYRIGRVQSGGNGTILEPD